MTSFFPSMPLLTDLLTHYPGLHNLDGHKRYKDYKEAEANHGHCSLF
jgi:hypothetical protein